MYYVQCKFSIEYQESDSLVNGCYSAVYNDMQRNIIALIAQHDGILVL
jgi:hypothetical protein